jgi:FRG domain
MSNPWSEFYEQIQEAKEKLGNPDPVWYRGLKLSAYELVPSLYRYSNGRAVERAIFEDFEAAGGRSWPNDAEEFPIDADWKALFFMQHYGIPTRLLDWTDSLPIAIAFAVLDRELDYREDGAVVVLDPLKLNKNGGQNELKRPDGSYRYKSVYWHHDPVTPEKPLAMATPKGYINDRMAGQRGTFVIYGEDQRPLDKISPDVVVRVTLPATAVEHANVYLSEVPVNDYEIYPDFEGFGKYIKRKHLRR